MRLTHEGGFAVSVPDVEVISTIGAGDSSVAGFCAAFAMGREKSECLINAVAYGTAACTTAGTNPPKKDDVDRIRRDIVLKKIN